MIIIEILNQTHHTIVAFPHNDDTLLHKTNSPTVITSMRTMTGWEIYNISSSLSNLVTYHELINIYKKFDTNTQVRILTC